MQPLVTILFVSGNISLNRVLKERGSSIPLKKITELFYNKIKSIQSTLMDANRYKNLIFDIIDETKEFTFEEALDISEKVSRLVLDELSFYSNNVKSLGKLVDANFANILEYTGHHITRQLLERKNELNKFVYLGNNQSTVISHFLDTSTDHKKKEYGDFIEQCLVVCNELSQYIPNEDVDNYTQLEILLELFKNVEKQFEFLHELTNIFYRLSSKEPGSMVSLSNVMDNEYRFSELTDFEFEHIIIAFLNLLIAIGIELPTPFHIQHKSFEIRGDIIERLKQKK